ncbi:helix-turn-helix domain-containing protein [Nonomuraea gerenzanensis]|uniref:Transcriptional regulator n=1 Tax=Nonomuraea gerenzanensis TaxID=93944 RepID=A0A1M4E4J9_9ACTN|nr:helix-turn-helix domain-containing protein [Nonomuraea gerenzanensis]UBU15950.1 helix-turn-helix domain-containing protein [Nonomuraea gerenzanensis]SBO93746.1 Transcriptional regulator [Nonomuraea gerenzanensis]
MNDLEAVSSERLGRRLRELRARSGKSLRAVARELGISASAVSQIERGTMRPSVSRLIAYVSAIGVPLAAVFDPDERKEQVEPPGGRKAAPPELAVSRAGEVAPIRLGGGVTFRRLSPGPTPDVEFFESTYPPHAVSTAHGRFLRHEGYEVGTVTAGELTIEFESEVVTLAEGDSITFPCSRPHIIGNRSATVTAVAVWLIVHAG